MLAVYEAHRGTEDKQTAACMTTLGVIMQEQGRWVLDPVQWLYSPG
jgi:hypothetical protein